MRFEGIMEENGNKTKMILIVPHRGVGIQKATTMRNGKLEQIQSLKGDAFGQCSCFATSRICLRILYSSALQSIDFFPPFYRADFLVFE